MNLKDWFIEQHADVSRLRRGRLFRKYFLLILAFVCGTLLVSGGIGLYFSYQENQRALALLQREKAVAAAARVEEFLFQIEQQLKQAALPAFGSEGPEQRRIEFLKLLRQADAVTDVTQIDARGREQISESRLKMSEIGTQRDWSQEPAFRSVRPGQTWFGPVYFRKETEPYMSIAVRASERGPVTVAEVNLKFIWDVVYRIKVGQNGKAYVVDGAGFLVADPDIGLVLRKTDLSRLGHVKAAFDPANDDVVARQALDLGGTRVLSAHAPIELREDRDGRKRDPLGWKVFVEQPLAEVYAGLQATVWRTIALIVAGLLFSGMAAGWLAGTMVRPIRTLRDGAQRIGEGDLDTQIDVRTGDELQGLAEQFNRMSGQLRESYAGLERKVEERTQQLKRSLDHQTAISEVLRVISGSPTDVQPVLEAVAERASRLCNAAFAGVQLLDGDVLHGAAGWSRDQGLIRIPEVPVRRTFISGRALLERRTIHVEDVLAVIDTEYPEARENQRLIGFKTFASVPMLREGGAVGVLSIWRDVVQPFSADEMKLLETFAAQAVIAIENVRLFNETKEALERQTATAEVLRVISSSPTDVQPVLDAIAVRAERLCDGGSAVVYLREGETLRRMAVHGPLVYQVPGSLTMPLSRGSTGGRAVLDARTIHVRDISAERETFPVSWEILQKYPTAGGLAPSHTMLNVPLVKDGVGIGHIIVRRGEVRPFTDKQIALLETFAAQAVIAIENVRLFREIQEKSAQLEVANKHKSDFLANMSHELRTPLNAIIGFSEVLSERMFGEINEKQADYLKDIHESGRHLLSLINDILDLSKIEAGRMELEVSSFDLPTALSNAMTLVRERAQRHGIALDLQVDRRLADFNADERKFKQIVLNLISNAVKFTTDGGRVDVSAKLNGTAVEIAVKDTGIGIAPEDQQKVFAEFVQVGRDYTRKAEGTGLGLALTKRFVELHGGEIRLASAPGKGSTFTFTLPVRP